MGSAAQLHLANSAAALPKVLGSTNVESQATQTSITRGLRASTPARVLAPSAASVRKLDKKLAAVLVVLGSRTVEMPATQTLVTRGPKASTPAKEMRSQPQRARTQSVPHVPSALWTDNLANSVVVHAVVLGSTVVAIGGTRILITRGSTGSRPAK